MNTSLSALTRLRIAVLVLAGATLSGMAISWKLWLTERFFPLTPVIAPLADLPELFSRLLFAAIILLVLLYAWKMRALFLRVLIPLLFIEVLIDQNRLQPWYYQYLLMWLLLLFYPNKSNAAAAEGILNNFRLIICGIYFWSGMQKLNAEYFNDTAFWLMQPLEHYLPVSWVNMLGYAAWAIGPFEICLAIGLLFAPARRFLLIPGILMHTYIILLMTPLGRDYNYVIIPWNLAMILFLLLLFSGKQEFTPRSILGSVKSIPQRIVFLLIWIMPSLSFFGKWDSYLSASLYSGNSDNGYLYITDELMPQLPQEIRRLILPDTATKMNYLYINNWSMEELNVPGVPEKRVFLQAKKKIEAYGKGMHKALLLIEHRLTLNGNEKDRNEVIE
ncbi:MAG: hypothetical protein AB1458_08315 [Bacteroidota bacterium]